VGQICTAFRPFSFESLDCDDSVTQLPRPAGPCLYGRGSAWRSLPGKIMVSDEPTELRARIATLEEELARAKLLGQRCEEAAKSEAVGALAAGVAHDFNNMIMTMLVYCDELDEILTQHEARADVATIRATAERAAWVTKQFLGFARRQPERPVVIDFNQQVSEVIAVARRVVHDDVLIHFAVDERVGNVLIDPAHLEHLVMNLVINAQESLAGGGNVYVATESREQSLAGLPEASICIVVRDEGRGIRAEHLSRIFEPFFTTKSGRKGKGLGLSTCLDMTERHGGRIAVTSELGRGTTVTVEFPVSAESPPSGHLSIPAASSGRRRVALVEDDEYVRKSLARVLSGAGYRVSEASDGQDAFDTLGTRISEYDLLITDVLMPRLNGAELALRLRELKPDLSILYVSGYTGDELAARGIDPGDQLLEKPVTKRRLLSAVRSAIGAA